MGGYGQLRVPWTEHTVIYEKDSGHGMAFRTSEGMLAISLHSPNHPGVQKRMRIYELEDLGSALRVGRQIGGGRSLRICAMRGDVVEYLHGKQEFP